MALEPITRQEQLLNAVATGETVNIKPITREEMFLAKAGGQNVTTPQPITRREMFLSKISGSSGGGGEGGDEGWIGDGNTHIWISLAEGRTSPMLGVCPKGTVTVDWGDGTTPDVLTGTSTTAVKWTPTHNYAKPGDYVITLTVDGEMRFGGDPAFDRGGFVLRHSFGSDNRNRAYLTTIHRVELGNGVTSIGDNAFNICYSLTSIVIPDGVTSIGDRAFNICYSLTSIVIPDGVTSIGDSAFYSCYSLTSIVIPDGVTSIGDSAFYSCSALASIVIPDGVTSIGGRAFNNCYSLASITIPESVTSIGKDAFYNCSSVRYYDFTNHTAVPTLDNANAFSSIPADCEIRVPAALYDEWIAETNWATYASYIKAV